MAAFVRKGDYLVKCIAAEKHTISIPRLWGAYRDEFLWSRLFLVYLGGE
jgi:hypothetical protein